MGRSYSAGHSPSPSSSPLYRRKSYRQRSYSPSPSPLRIGYDRSLSPYSPRGYPSVSPYGRNDSPGYDRSRSHSPSYSPPSPRSYFPSLSPYRRNDSPGFDRSRSHSPSCSPIPSPSPSPSPLYSRNGNRQRNYSPGYDRSLSPPSQSYSPRSPSPSYSPSPSPLYRRGYDQNLTPSSPRSPSTSTSPEPESDNDGSGEETDYRQEISRRGYSEKGKRYTSIKPPPQSKRCRTSLNQEDGISKLPDSILLHILSFLPTEEAVRTSILSKRWTHLWTAVPCLSFSSRGFDCTLDEDFFSFVNETLVLHRPSRMEKFSLHFPYRPHSAPRVNRWLRLVSTASVEELSLDLYGWEIGNDTFDHYTLPQHLYTNSSLKKLNLSWCKITPKQISWNSLKSLSIGYIELSRALIRKIDGGCPFLEYVEVYKFYGIDCLEFTGRCLNKLVIRDCWDKTNQRCNSVLEIRAPWLLSLAILGDMHRLDFRVVHSDSLVECCLNFEQVVYHKDRDDNYIHHQNMLKQLLEDLGHVKQLTMGSWCLQVLSMLELKLSPLPLSKRSCMVLDTHMVNGDLPGIANLLKTSPHLETLVVNMTSPLVLWFTHVDIPDPNPGGENYWTSQERTFTSLLSHLNTVKINGFVARNSNELVIPFIWFLLKNARVLEKMTINAQRVVRNRLRKGFTSQELFEVAQKLLTFPRASQHAVVTFSE